MSSLTSYSATIHSPDYFQSPPTQTHLWKKTYCVQIIDGNWLEIPLCALPGEQEAIALLMSNQCDFPIIEHLTTLMANQASSFAPDCIAAVPTMGLEYASRIAQKLGKPNFVAMGFSHKFWYKGQISEPVTSTTSPDQMKHLYLDPHLLSRIQGKRVVVVDDVINTGSSVLAAIRLLKRAGAHVVGTVIALTEGHTWKTTLTDPFIKGSSEIKAIGHIPIFKKQSDGWVALSETL